MLFLQRCVNRNIGNMKKHKKVHRGVTIRDVAEASGVSAMTVTRCFGNGYIALKTQRKIEAAAQELGYVPNQLAQTLRHGKSNVIGGLWLLSMPHPTTHVAYLLGHSIGKAGYTPWINNTLAQWIQVRAALRDFLSHQVDGLIFQANKTLLGDKEILQLLKGFPAVLLVAPEELDLPYDQLVHRRGTAIEEMIEYLTGKGRRSICLLASEAGNRDEAFIKNVMSNSYIKYHEIIRPYDTHPYVGEGICRALVEKYPETMPFDAIISTSDEGAAAVVSMLQKRGLKVPEDIAVIGCNDSDFSRYFNPPLATATFHYQELADTATAMLINRMKNHADEKKRKFLDMTFIPRESAG
jgi:DNA-binding LacI/PurR family transcriptional regulator